MPTYYEKHLVKNDKYYQLINELKHKSVELIKGNGSEKFALKLAKDLNIHTIFECPKLFLSFELVRAISKHLDQIYIKKFIILLFSYDKIIEYLTKTLSNEQKMTISFQYFIHICTGTEFIDFLGRWNWPINDKFVILCPKHKLSTQHLKKFLTILRGFRSWTQLFVVAFRMEDYAFIKFMLQNYEQSIGPKCREQIQKFVRGEAFVELVEEQTTFRMKIKPCNPGKPNQDKNFYGILGLVYWHLT